MRTYLFSSYLEDKHGKFLPMQTIESEEFGRHFFLDIGFHFISAPSLVTGGYDESQLDYVNNWTETEGLDLDKLLEIYRKLTWTQWQEDKDKAHSDMCEYMEAVESGEIQFL
tara:strand:+ start:58 stop:393 length:336 start_codon:yes stop_codon:yes gene_type:complete